MTTPKGPKGPKGMPLADAFGSALAVKKIKQKKAEMERRKE